MERRLDPNNLAHDEDWVGNNIAIKCHHCFKTFLVSAALHRNGRDCPECGATRGKVTGGRQAGGSATVTW